MDATTAKALPIDFFTAVPRSPGCAVMDPTLAGKRVRDTEATLLAMEGIQGAKHPRRASRGLESRVSISSSESCDEGFCSGIGRGRAALAVVAASREGSYLPIFEVKVLPAIVSLPLPSERPQSVSPPRLDRSKALEARKEPPSILRALNNLRAIAIQRVCEDVMKYGRVTLRRCADRDSAPDPFTLTELGRGDHSIAYIADPSSSSSSQRYIIKVYHRFTDHLGPQIQRSFAQFQRLEHKCVVAPILNDPLVDYIFVQTYIPGVTLSGFEGDFTLQQLDDFTSLLSAFVDEYNRDIAIDILPANLIVSTDGRIVLIDFEEGWEGFHGICQLRKLFQQVFLKNRKRVEQGCDLLRHIRSISKEIYNLAVAPNEKSNLVIFKLRIYLQDRGMDPEIAHRLSPEFTLLITESFESFEAFMEMFPGYPFDELQVLPSFMCKTFFSKPETFHPFRGVNFSALATTSEAVFIDAIKHPEKPESKAFFGGLPNLL